LTTSTFTTFPIGRAPDEPRVAAVRLASGTHSERARTGPAPVQFQAREDFSMGGAIGATEIGDFTADGRPDLVAAGGGSNCPCATYLYKQRPNGSLTEPTAIPSTDTFYSPHDAAQGDLDGDQDLDLAVGTSEGIEIYFQDAGTLQAPVEFDLPFPGRGEMAVGDVSGDGADDVAVRSDALYLLTDTTAGSDFVAVDPDPSGGAQLVMADVNDDGLTDLVSADAYRLYVYPNDGAGGLGDAVVAGRPTDRFGVFDVGDANDDGRLDLFVAGGGNTAKLNVFLQKTDGTFTRPVVHNTYDIPDSATAADVNGDGRKDLVIGHGTWEAFGIYLQRADGTLANEKLYRTGYWNLEHGAISVGDLNGDDRADVAIGDIDARVHVFRQAPKLTITAPSKADYRDDVRWTAFLGPHDITTNQIVRVYVEVEGKRTLIAEKTVNDDGEARGLAEDLRRNVDLVVEWEGDARYTTQGSSTGVRVAARAQGRMQRFRNRSGKYHVYRSGDPAFYVGRVLPEHERATLRFELARDSSGHFKVFATTGVRMDENGLAGVRIAPLPAGVNYRIRCVFRGSRQNLPDTSPWSYFRFT
jgi:hypothetical protein